MKKFIIIFLAIWSSAVWSADRFSFRSQYFSNNPAGYNPTPGFMSNGNDEIEFVNAIGDGVLKVWMVDEIQGRIQFFDASSGTKGDPIIASSCGVLQIQKEKGLCKAIFLRSGQEIIISLNEAVYNPDSLYSVFLDFYPEDISSYSASDWNFEFEERVFPMYQQMQRFDFKDRLAGVVDAVSTASTAIVVLDALASVSESYVTPKKVGGKVIPGEYVLNEAFGTKDIASAMNAVQKVGNGMNNPEAGNPFQWDDRLTYLVDAGEALTKLLLGDPSDAYQTIIMNFSQAAVYGWGIYSLNTVEDDIDSFLIIDEIYYRYGYRRYTDDEIKTYAAQLALSSEQDCGWWSGVPGPCGLGEYKEDVALNNHHNLWAAFDDYVYQKIRAGNLYPDIDGDGVTNVDELTAGTNPNDPSSKPPQPPNLLPVAIINASATDNLNMGQTITIDSNDSYDPDGTIQERVWSVVVAPPGSSAVLSSLTGVTTTFTPDVEGKYYIQLGVSDGNTTVYEVVTLTVPVTVTDIEYTPSANNVYPDYSSTVAVGSEIQFKVQVIDVDYNLSHVIWVVDGPLTLLESDNRDPISASAVDAVGYAYETMRVRVDGDNNGYPMFVRAYVYDQAGNISVNPAKWVINGYQTYKPVLTRTYPATADIDLNLGTYDFQVALFDQDDNSGDITWYLNGVSADISYTNGGSPSATETGRIIFPSRGVYEVKAVVSDENGSTSELIWSVNAGMETGNNLPPVLSGIPFLDPNEVQFSDFRVGRRYSFVCEATDPDSNLYNTSISLDGGLLSERVSRYSDASSQHTHGDLYFDTVGEHVVTCKATDGAGETVVSQRTVSVKAADSTAGSAPLLTVYPQSDSWSSPSSSFEINGRIKDPDYDANKVLVYLNGNLIREERLYGDASFNFYVGANQGVPATGVHQLKIVGVDANGNRSNEIVKTIRPNTNNNQSPLIAKTVPSDKQTIRITQEQANAGIELWVIAQDADGDLGNIEWDLAGVNNVRADLITPRYTYSDNVSGSLGNSRVVLRPQKSGRIYINALDDLGHSASGISWDIVIDNTVANRVPVIYNRSYTNGDTAVKSSDPSYGVSVEFDVYDEDANLKSITLFVNDAPVASRSLLIESRESVVDNSFLTSAAQNAFADVNFLSRGDSAVVKLVIEDWAGATVSEEFTVIQGPFGYKNHAPQVDTAIAVSTSDIDSVEFSVNVFDEEGDTPIPSIGAVSSGVLEYIGNYLFRYVPEKIQDINTASLTIEIPVEWNDGFGGLTSTNVSLTIERTVPPPELSREQKLIVVNDPSDAISFGELLAESVSSTDFSNAQLTFNLLSSQGVIFTGAPNLNLLYVGHLQNGSSTGYITGTISDPVGNSSNQIAIYIKGSDFDVDGIADYIDDSDIDLMLDSYELANGLNPLDSFDASSDFDGDGLTALEEFNAGTRADMFDTDFDGDSDSEEIAVGSNPNDPMDTIDLHRPIAPTLIAFTDQQDVSNVVLRADPFSDPDLLTGDSISADQWQLANDLSFSSLLIDRIRSGIEMVNDGTVFNVPNGLLPLRNSYYFRARHRDSTGLWSNWSVIETLTIKGISAYDGDDDGVVDQYQVYTPTDINSNGYDDSLEDIKVAYDAINAEIVGFDVYGTNIRNPRGTIISNLSAVDLNQLPNNLLTDNNMPYGMFEFTVDFVDAGFEPLNPTTIEVTVHFPEILPQGTRWLMLDTVTNTLIDYTSNVTFDGNRAILSLTDGDLGDLDKIVNGIIHDPGGPAFPMSDTDLDGIADNIDNCTNVSNPSQLDTDADGYGNHCDADLNNDGIVNAIDLGLFKQAFFTFGNVAADINGDGVVNSLDLGLFKRMFFQQPGPSALIP